MKESTAFEMPRQNIEIQTSLVHRRNRKVFINKTEMCYSVYKCTEDKAGSLLKAKTNITNHNLLIIHDHNMLERIGVKWILKIITELDRMKMDRRIQEHRYPRPIRVL